MKFTRLATICVTMTALAAAVACVPDPLEGFGNTTQMPPANNPNGMPGGDTGMTTTDMGGGGGGNFNPQFLAVSAILKQNCALAGCHGNGAGLVFSVQTGANATDAEMQASLSTAVTALNGNRLIEPNNAAESEIYDRINRPAGDIQLMGAGTYGAMATPLTPDQISTIEMWINNGATYTQ